MNTFSSWDEVPLFDREEAEAAFWAENRPDLRLMEASVVRSAEASDSVAITLRIDPRMLSKIKRLARSRYLNYQSMIKQWLSERMEQELREINQKPAGEYRPSRLSNGFTLLELMIVVSIMGILAALVVGMARHASDQKKITRVTAELAKWTVMIDNYHSKLGYYPPSNPAHTFGPAATPLFYELAGAEFDGTTYTTLTTKDKIAKPLFKDAFGLDGLANSATEKGEAVTFGQQIQAADIIELPLPGLNAPVKVPRVPVDGPTHVPLNDAKYGKMNTWHYNSRTPTNNPNSYDLWAEILVGGKTNIIGNWKR